MTRKPRFQASTMADGTTLELLVYGDIVDAGTITMLESWGYPTDDLTSAISIKKAIDAAGNYSKIAVRINSPGGDAFEGIAAYNILRAQGKPVDVFVDGIAASSASIIAMAGDTVTMGVNSMLMCHEAWMNCSGNAGDMRKAADTLDKVSESIGATYVKKTGKSAEEIQALMAAETWMSAADCVKEGFATAIAEDPGTGAQAMNQARKFKALARMKNVPVQLKAKPKATDACECGCDPCVNGDCAGCSDPDCTCAGCVDCPMQSLEDSTNLSQYEARLHLLGKH